MLENSIELLGAFCVGFVLFSLEIHVCHGIDYCGVLCFHPLCHVSAFCCACVLQYLWVMWLLCLFSLSRLMQIQACNTGESVSAGPCEALFLNVFECGVC